MRVTSTQAFYADRICCGKITSFGHFPSRPQTSVAGAVLGRHRSARLALDPAGRRVGHPPSRSRHLTAAVSLQHITATSPSREAAELLGPSQPRRTRQSTHYRACVATASFLRLHKRSRCKRSHFCPQTPHPAGQLVTPSHASRPPLP